MSFKSFFLILLFLLVAVLNVFVFSLSFDSINQPDTEKVITGGLSILMLFIFNFSLLKGMKCL